MEEMNRRAVNELREMLTAQQKLGAQWVKITSCFHLLGFEMLNRGVLKINVIIKVMTRLRFVCSSAAWYFLDQSMGKTNLIGACKNSLLWLISSFECLQLCVESYSVIALFFHCYGLWLSHSQPIRINWRWSHNQSWLARLCFPALFRLVPVASRQLSIYITGKTGNSGWKTK